MNKLARAAVGVFLAVATATTLVGCEVIMEVKPQRSSAVAPGSASPPPQGLRTPTLTRSHQRIDLQAGTYHGDLVLRGSNQEVRGQGAGRTVINGSLSIQGNKCRVRNLTVTGSVRINGNNNELDDVEVRGSIEAKGNKNKY